MHRGAEPIFDEIEIVLQAFAFQVFRIRVPANRNVGMRGDIENRLDHRQVLLGQTIRTIGTQDVRVRLTRNVFASVTVSVAPELTEAEQAEAAGPSIAEALAEVEAEEAAQDEAAETEAAAGTSE